MKNRQSHLGYCEPDFCKYGDGDNCPMYRDDEPLPFPMSPRKKLQERVERLKNWSVTHDNSSEQLEEIKSILVDIEKLLPRDTK